MTLVFVGPSLYDSELRPQESEIWLPPAAQADIASAVVEHRPEQIVLIDGVFSQNMSVWHKELMFALAQPYVKRVIGAASMGALRAADLRHWGMVGVGEIYKWYAEGWTEDDSEVALSYNPETYQPLTVPLCNIRATMYAMGDDFPIICHAGHVPFDDIFFADRTPGMMLQIMGGSVARDFWCYYVDQKQIDAEDAIRYARTEPLTEPEKRPTEEDYNSLLFQALYERDRIFQGKRLYELEEQEHFTEQDYKNAVNRELALMLCDTFGIEGANDEARLEYLQLSFRWSRPPCGLTKSVLQYKGKL